MSMKKCKGCGELQTTNSGCLANSRNESSLRCTCYWQMDADWVKKRSGESLESNLNDEEKTSAIANAVVKHLTCVATNTGVLFVDAALKNDRFITSIGDEIIVHLEQLK